MNLGVGLLERGSGTQARDGGHEIAAPIVVRIARIDVDRSPNLGRRSREAEVARHHANDFALHAVERDQVTENVRIGLELPLPQRIAQDDETVLTADIVPGVKSAADRGFGAKDRKKLGGNRRTAQPDRIAEAGEVEFVAFSVSGEVHRFGSFAERNQRAFGKGAVEADKLIWV